MPQGVSCTSQVSIWLNRADKCHEPLLTETSWEQTNFHSRNSAMTNDLQLNRNDLWSKEKEEKKRSENWSNMITAGAISSICMIVWMSWSSGQFTLHQQMLASADNVTSHSTAGKNRQPAPKGAMGNSLDLQNPVKRLLFGQHLLVQGVFFT